MATLWPMGRMRATPPGPAPPRVAHCCSPASREGAPSRAPRSRVETPVFGSSAARTRPKASGCTGTQPALGPLVDCRREARVPLAVSPFDGHRHPGQVVRVLIDASAFVLTRQKDRQPLRIQADVTGVRGGPTASAQMIISVMGAGAL